jgi:hypothetical protein
VPFETTPLKLWQSLARADREEAARAFWEHPPEGSAAEAARAVVDLLRVRPQAFHKVPVEARVRALAGLARPSESVAEALLVALHVECRRQLLVDFLDAAGIAHEDGVLDDPEGEPEALGPDVARQAAGELAERHSPAAVRVYWNALWLQDRERWAALEPVADELA